MGVQLKTLDEQALVITGGRVLLPVNNRTNGRALWSGGRVAAGHAHHG
jgi:hypothetical protein